MSDSTRRALRTAYQYLVAALALALVLVVFVEPVRAIWPQAGAFIAGIATAAGIATRLLNAFEDHFPDWAVWLKTPDTYRLPDSTRRAIRTAIAGIVGTLGFVAGLSVFLPQLGVLFPDQAPLLTAVIAGAALLAKIAAAPRGRRPPNPHPDPAGEGARRPARGRRLTWPSPSAGSPRCRRTPRA